MEVFGLDKVVSKYDNSLGDQARARWHHGAGRKARWRWATIHARKVEELRVRVMMQLQVSGLLLGPDELSVVTEPDFY